MKQLFCLLAGLFVHLYTFIQMASSRLLLTITYVFAIIQKLVEVYFSKRVLSYKNATLVVFTVVFLLINSLTAEGQTPTISSFAPTIICQGDAVTITGTNFTGATSVKAGTDEALSFKVNSATSITAVVSYQSSTGTIVVTTPNGTIASSTNLIIQTAPLPSLQDVSPLVDIAFTNCNGNSTYQITVQNNSTQVATGSVYDIDWGDNTTHFMQTNWAAGAQTPHTFTSQGYFNIKLTITPPYGCARSVVYKFYNGTNPLASFTTTSSTTGLCVPALVTFKIGDWFKAVLISFHLLAHLLPLPIKKTNEYTR